MGILLRASTKLVATFIVTLALFLLFFMFFPKGIIALQDLAAGLNDLIRTPAFLDEQAMALYRTFINDSTLLGVIVTAIARLLIEVVAYVVGGLYGHR